MSSAHTLSLQSQPAKCSNPSWLTHLMPWGLLYLQLYLPGCSCPVRAAGCGFLICSPLALDPCSGACLDLDLCSTLHRSPRALMPNSTRSQFHTLLVQCCKNKSLYLSSPYSARLDSCWLHAWHHLIHGTTLLDFIITSMCQLRTRKLTKLNSSWDQS